MNNMNGCNWLVKGGLRHSELLCSPESQVAKKAERVSQSYVPAPSEGVQAHPEQVFYPILSTYTQPQLTPWTRSSRVGIDDNQPQTWKTSLPVSSYRY